MTLDGEAQQLYPHSWRILSLRLDHYVAISWADLNGEAAPPLTLGGYNRRARADEP